MNTNQIAIIIENGLVSEVRGTNPDTHVHIIDLDPDYAGCEKRESVYNAVTEKLPAKIEYNTYTPTDF